MICTTIQNRNLEQIYEALQQCEMAEIRLDRCELSAKEIEELFTADVPLVATCRISEVAANEPSLQGMTEQSREIKAMQIAEKRLIKAIESGARYVDVELEAPKQMSKRVRQAAHENGTVFIRSYHDFNGTDSMEALKAIVEKCVYHGADMVKLVTMAATQEDVDRVMSLYGWCRGLNASGGKDDDGVGRLADGGLIAFCMGEAGRQSRLDALRHGAPYTYAALSHEESAAPGQWAAGDMMKAVYDGFRFIETDESLSMPVSKSFAQRAIVAAALAEGTSHLHGYTPCGDNESALEVARSLGAKVDVNGTEVTITGIAASFGCISTLSDSDSNDGGQSGSMPVLNVGESGLLARMMIPVMAQLCPSGVSFGAEGTLLRRNLTGAKDIMEAFEAYMTDSCMPLSVHGPLKAGRAEVSGKHGSQMISGLLMALPFAERNSSLVVREPKSIPYTFITLEVLKKFGIKIGNDMLGGPDFMQSGGDWSLCTEMVFKIRGGQKYKAADVDLECDWSAAANFLVAGAIFGQTELAGLDTTSLQADLSIMDILMDAGASLSQLDGDKGNITVQRAPLKAFNVDASNCPDLFPITAVLAAFCQGTSRIEGVGRLANKESDRAKAIVDMLSQMGVTVNIEGDVMVIEGHSLAQRLLNRNAAVADSLKSEVPEEAAATVCQDQSSCGLLKGGSYTSHHDHRMVMALKVAELGADCPIVIDDEECVAKSFPQFHEIFRRLCDLVSC